MATSNEEDILRALYSELSTTLDARVVAAKLYESNTLTLKELQSIQSLKDRPVEAAEALLNIIMGQPDDVYRRFLDILKHTDGHIYQRLVEGGYKGRYGDFKLNSIAGIEHNSVVKGTRQNAERGGSAGRIAIGQF